ncbi:ABC transporter permease [Acetivibrio cellulolyticus]|uniref:ABC transporter permease n=1 Tax=Acetivibrio cellulolyticus TaxID=35830 RepID=UPI0001E2D0C8|nr:ABC transporter permease [Acetivibrio cellulolyticus]
MSFFESFQMAIGNILARKVRSLLTMLGIIIGIVAVIVIVGLGNGMENYLVDTFKSMGTNLLTVNITGRGSTRNVSTEDMFKIVEENPEYLESLSPNVSVTGQVKIGSETTSETTVTGVGEAYMDMKDYKLAIGRFISYIDTVNRNKVVVIGKYLSNEYFNGRGIGETLRINGQKFEIVGVLDAETDDVDEIDEGSTDDAVYIPYSTATKMFASFGARTSYSFAVKSDDLVSKAKDLIDKKLYDVFEDDNAYVITSMSELLDTMTSMINIVITILAVIAGISLVVGGIGIMNIMLVSVSERTREIGIRKALGAKQKHIMRQFVIEASTTSAIGGIIGIIIGYALSSVGTKVISMLTETDIIVTPSTASVLLAFGISVGIGMLFGYLPAKTAARLNPIDALRYE